MDWQNLFCYRVGQTEIINIIAVAQKENVNIFKLLKDKSSTVYG